MILCLCEGVNERTVQACVRDGARSVKEVAAKCGAGRGCGLCIRDLRRALHSREEQRPEGERPLLAK